MRLRSFAWEGKRALVTGASSGIGRELARELARRGVRVAVVARREARLAALVDEIVVAGQPRPAVVAADLSRPGAAARVAAEAADALGDIDLLVNNAGVGVGGLQWVVGDHDAARETFETNYWSPLALCRALVPAMRIRGEGAIANVTSMAQLMTWPMMGHYTASKAALALATETLRLELQGSGIHVLEVIPGPVDTAIQGETRLVPGLDRVLARSPVGDPARLARLVVRALERGANRIIYPRLLAAAYVAPSLARCTTPRLVARVRDDLNLDDHRIIRSGSMGDELVRHARADWERTHGRTV